MRRIPSRWQSYSIESWNDFNAIKEILDADPEWINSPEQMKNEVLKEAQRCRVENIYDDVSHKYLIPPEPEVKKERKKKATTDAEPKKRGRKPKVTPTPEPTPGVSTSRTSSWSAPEARDPETPLL